MNKRKAGEAAPYGQACLQCFKSKCKCVLRSEGDKCERCHRLGRQCEPSEAIRRRRIRKSPGSAPKIVQLEGKIDSLVTLLRSVGESSATSNDLRSVLEQNASKPTGQLSGAQSESSAEVHTSSEAASPAPVSMAGANRAVSSSLAAPIATPPSEVSPENDTSRLLLSLSTPIDSSDTSSEDASAAPGLQADAEQEMCLEVFRTSMLPRCPIIAMPPEKVSAATLKRDRPVFFQAICAVAAPSRQVKVDRYQDLKRVIATKMVVENTASLDLLFALLTFVAWSNDFLHDKAGLSRYMALAISLVWDLYLKTPQRPGDWNWKKDKILPTTKKGIPTRSEVDEMSTGGLLERSRAVLGCFVLSQCIQSHFNQIDSLQWTSHLDECLRLLETQEDEPSDAVLVFQTRLHRIAQKAADVHRQTDESSPAIMLYLGVLRDQLWDVKIPQISNDGLRGFLKSHVWYIELCIWDALHDYQPKPLAPVLRDSSLRTQRIERLWKSVTAAKSYFDITLSLPPLTWVGVSFLEMCQITRSFKTILQLAIHEDPAWDKQAVREVCDPLSVMDPVIRIAADVSTAIGETHRDDLFCTLSNTTRGLREWARLCLGKTVDVSDNANGEASPAERPPDEETWDFHVLPPMFGITALPAYGFFGAGEWMRPIFDEPY